MLNLKKKSFVELSRLHNLIFSIIMKFIYLIILGQWVSLLFKFSQLITFYNK